MKTAEEFITPEIAEKYLATQSTNRKLHHKHVKLLASAMLNGEWVDDTAESIKFDKFGRLVDGQHRLLAVVKSGMPRKFSVTYGISQEAVMAIDGGCKRSNADRLSMSGFVSAQHVSRIASYIYTYENGYLADKSGCTFQTIEQIVKDIPPGLLSEALSYGWKLNKNHILPVSAGGFLFLVFIGAAGKEQASLFMEKLISGEQFSGGCPIKALRDRLLISKDRPYVKVMMAIYAWRAFRENKAIKCLKKTNFMTFTKAC